MPYPPSMSGKLALKLTEGIIDTVREPLIVCWVRIRELYIPAVHINVIFILNQKIHGEADLLLR